jgi:hypothetical protein
MTAEEFATKYADYHVKLSPRVADKLGVPLDLILGRCIGHRISDSDGRERIVIDPTSRSLNFFTGFKFRYTNTSQDSYPTNRRLTTFRANNVIPVNKPKIYKIVPYPHKCKICKSPARVCVSFVMCSNDHCKTRKEIRKLAATAPKLMGIDRDGYVLCKICQARITHASGLRYVNVVCGYKHAATHTWQEGELYHHRGTKTYIFRKSDFWPVKDKEL